MGASVVVAAPAGSFSMVVLAFVIGFVVVIGISVVVLAFTVVSFVVSF
jgi:hypothetical protein